MLNHHTNFTTDAYTATPFITLQVIIMKVNKQLRTYKKKTLVHKLEGLKGIFNID